MAAFGAELMERHVGPNRVALFHAAGTPRAGKVQAVTIPTSLAGEEAHLISTSVTVTALLWGFTC